MSLVVWLPAAFILLAVPVLLGGAVENQWLNQEAIVVATAVAAVLVVMALFRHVFPRLIALLLVAFILQRVVVLYVWPAELDYQAYLYLTDQAVTAALAYILWCTVAILLGFLVVRFAMGSRAGKPLPGRGPHPIIGGRVSFELFFLAYVAIALPLAFFTIWLLLTTQAGVAGFLIPKPLVILYRASESVRTIAFLAYLALLSPGMMRLTKALAGTLLAVSIVIGVLTTTKALFLNLFLDLVVVVYFLRGSVPRRYMVLGGVVLLLAVEVYAPIAVAMRNGLVFEDSLGGILTRVATAPFAGPAKAAFDFSARLGGLDSQVALMTVGGTAFPDYVSARGDFIAVINSLVPGDLVSQERWVSPAYVMPYVLRGVPLPGPDAISAHGENFGIFGTAFLYFGAAGPFALAVWAAVSTWVLSSRAGPFWKMLYAGIFVLSLFSGGALSTVVIKGYEALLWVLIVYAAYHLVYLARRPRGRPAVALSAARGGRGTQRGSSAVPRRQRDDGGVRSA